MESNVKLFPDGRIYLFRKGKPSLMVGLFNRGILYGRKERKHVYRYIDGFGFNRQMIEIVPFVILCVEFENQQLLTTKKYFLKHCFEDQFEGFEKQLFFRIRDFNIEKALHWEHKERTRDLTIFELFGNLENQGEVHEN